jgi:hypothetical protein
VEGFRADCRDVLLQLAALTDSADDGSPPELDVADMRLTSLDEDLAAARAEAAVVPIGPDAAAGGDAQLADTAAGASSVACNARGAAGDIDAGIAHEHGDADASSQPASAPGNAAERGTPTATASLAGAANGDRAGASGNILLESPRAASPRSRRRKPSADSQQMPVVPQPTRRSARKRQPSREALRAAAHASEAHQLQVEKLDNEDPAHQPSAADAFAQAGRGMQQPGQQGGEDAAEADSSLQQQPPRRQQASARASKRG